MISLDFAGKYILVFAGFFLVLIVLKIILTIYRIATGKWPASLKFLCGIINWRVEIYKILLLAGLAFLVSLLIFR